MTFLCFLSGCLGSLVLANASSCLQLRFARVSAQEEALAPRSDQNKVFGHFSNCFGSLFFVLFFGWVASIGLQCEAGGKPSTMVTAGKLVEHSCLQQPSFLKKLLLTSAPAFPARRKETQND